MIIDNDTILKLVKTTRALHFHKSELEAFAVKEKLDVNDLREYIKKNSPENSNPIHYNKVDVSALINHNEHPELDFMNFIPEVDDAFYPNGNYDDVKKILTNPRFIPQLLTGPTGAGKTLMVDQIHAELRKPIVRVNITVESDEDSLMGGLRLRDGSTVFDKGPVIRAMEMGATLMLDELDLANPGRILCLQSVLEGKGYLIKKTSEFVRPAPGFTIIATANTKGAGDETGVYIATNTLNAAMMDRFTLFFDCDYPTESAETKILNKVLTTLDFEMPDEEIEHLVKWAKATRSDKVANFELEYSISTRRLVDIVKVNQVIGLTLEDAVKMCLNRFDSAHKDAFLQAFTTLKPKKKSRFADDVDDAAEADEIVFDEDNNLDF